MCLKCRIDLGIKTMEKGKKLHFMGTFRRLVPVQFEFVPVQFRYWSFLANFYRYNLGLYRYNCYSVPSFDQFWYFSHNLLISYPI